MVFIMKIFVINILRFVKIIFVVDFSELRIERLIYKCLHLRQVHQGCLFNIFPLPTGFDSNLVPPIGDTSHFLMMYRWHKNMLIGTDVHTDVKNQYLKNIDKYIE